MNNRGSNASVAVVGRDSSPRMMNKESSPSSSASMYGDGTIIVGRSNFDKSDDPKLDLQNPSSIFRENLRLRVRDDEKRLTDLIRQRREEEGRDYYFSGGESKTSDEHITTKDFSRRATTTIPTNGNGYNSLYDKLLDIEEGFSNQTRKIRALEGNIANRDDEIKKLREELVKKLERIVDLEFELKASVPQYDEDLLSLTGDQLYDIDLDGSIRDNGRSVEMQRAKLMVTKLMADLRNLESRYKEDQLKSARAIEELRLQNGELHETKTSKVTELEQRVREIEKECLQLERRVQVKDMQIGNLKKELAALRIDQLSGRRRGSNDGQYSDFDRDLLRSLPTANDMEYTRTSSLRRGRDDTLNGTNDDESKDQDRDVMRPTNFDRNRSLSRSRAPSPGRNIRFAEDTKEEEALASAKEAQQELVRQSLQRAGSFSSRGQLSDHDSARMTEYDMFVRNEEQRGRGSFREDGSNSIGGNSVSGGRRSDDLRAVKQDQEQAIQRAKTNRLFRQASRRLFGRAY